ncbi:probable aminotransferase TAT2 [Cynara cardunculus var. scolymus]|uniref:probable aminotransferase TAT2 n=1 Tax=Cynara cardunculus var. scolymus TaxID=59895 RepID=UPI000D626895|nr:probable aminotransferase TAT2 [Cynara cardunculus var. scolymus]
MENSSTLLKKWGFMRNSEQKTESDTDIDRVLTLLMSSLNISDSRPIIPMAHGEPSAFSCFSKSQFAADAIAEAVQSAKFNGYSPTGGVLSGRRAVAEYLSQDLPEKLSPDDVFLTMGCKQAAQTILTVLAGTKSNILFPKPGFPYYEVFAQSCHLETRHFDLLPEKDWEIDLDSVVAVADENTVAMVIINPGNPCGNVFTHQHIKKVAETARKLGILVIADEVYDHLAFGKNPFVPMGVFGSITPVITLGSLSKRWAIPGWRLGWLVTHDPNGILKEHGIIECIKGYFHVFSNLPTFIQGALPEILGKSKEGYPSETINTIKEAANSCYKGIIDIPGVTCPSKPEGSIFTMVKLDLSVFEDIEDDLDFCLKLAKEESVLILPGISVGLKNWLRVTFVMDQSSLQEGITRIQDFCRRHSHKA